MSGYFDPEACPGCRFRIEMGSPVCPTCRMRLDEPAAWRLSALLREADALVRQLREPPGDDPRPDAAPWTAQPPPASLRPDLPPPDLSPPDLPPPAPSPHRGIRAPALSVPAVLLGLGALCVLVAAVVFVAVSWGDLSVGARTLLLLAVTAAFAGGALSSVRAGLRGSAEALWLVVAGMLALDAVGARTAGLLGLDAASDVAYVTACGLVALVGFAALARWSASSRVGALVTAELIAGTGWLAVVIAQGERWPGDAGWYAALVTVASAAVAVAARLLGLRVLAWVPGAVAVLAWLTLSAYGLWEAVDAPDLSRLWGAGAGGLLLTAGVLAAPVAAVPARWFDPTAPARVVAAAAAVGALGLLAWLPLSAAGATPGVTGLAAATAGLASLRLLAAPGAARPWVDGATVVAALGMLGCLLAVAVLAFGAAETAWDAALPVWESTAGSETVSYQLADATAAWTLPVLLVALAWSGAVVVGADPWLPIALAASVAGAGLPLLDEVPLAVAVAAPAGFGTLLLVAAAARGVRPADRVGWLLVVAASVLALGSTGLTAAVSTGVAVVAAGCCRVRLDRDARAVLAVTTVLAAAVGAFGWLSLGSTSLAGRALVVALLVPVALATAQVTRAAGTQVRLGQEVGATLVAATALLVLADEDSPGRLAVALTALGVAVALVALLVPDRRRAAPLGALLLAAASWVRLADTGVEVVEAYTLPSALVLAVAGAWWLRSDADVGTVSALGAGLGLAIGPSLLLALEDPVSPRGLLVGVASLGLVLGGAWLHWGAPLVVGAGALALLAVRQLGPLALVVPRWTLFALAGALLLTGGVTWERRRRELVAAARYVADLR